MAALITLPTLVTYTPHDIDLAAIFISIERQEIHVSYKVRNLLGVVVDKKTITLSGQDFLGTFTLANSYGPAGSNVSNMIQHAVYDKIAQKTGMTLTVL